MIENPKPTTLFWQDFHRPFVRDLAFVLSCPSVLTQWHNPDPTHPTPPIEVHSTSFWQQQFQDFYPRLCQLDRTPAYQELTRFLMRRPSPHRLGFHFEGLMLFWLQDGFTLGLHAYEVIAHNVQLYRERQTIGELDLIIRNHSQSCIEHWELAIKFYLGSAPFSPEYWIGINSKDTLYKKMHHMQTKQFHCTWVDTSSEHRIKIDRRFAVIKGRFFIPHSIQPAQLMQPPHSQTLSTSTNVHDSSFEHPDWLTPSFPLHYWYNPHDAAALLQSTAEHDMVRPARYIEWFTSRPFYNTQSRPSESNTNHDNLDKLKTGLYFLLQTPALNAHNLTTLKVMHQVFLPPSHS